MTSYTLYVPAPGATHDIWQGSAIVGEERDGIVHTHYEGGGALNVQTLEQKINQAAGRRRERYPTSAQRAWMDGDALAVGTVGFDETMRHWVITELTDESALRAWVGQDQDIVVGGSATLIQECGGRIMGQLPMHEQTRIIAMRLPMTAMCAEAISALRRINSR